MTDVAKSKFEHWCERFGLEYVRRLAEDGLPDEEIAARSGIELSTFRKWRTLYPHFSAAIDLGRTGSDYAVVEALYKKAVGYRVPINKTVKLRCVSALSPFLKGFECGSSYGSYIGSTLGLKAETDYILELAKQGRVALSFAENDNFLGCSCGVEAIVSEDGLVFGQLSQPARLQKDVRGGFLDVIKSAVGYFKSEKTQENEAENGENKTDCNEENNIVISWDGFGKPMECETKADCGENFVGYCDNGTVKLVMQILNK